MVIIVLCTANIRDLQLGGIGHYLLDEVKEAHAVDKEGPVQVVDFFVGDACICQRDPVYPVHRNWVLELGLQDAIRHFVVVCFLQGVI